MLAAIAIAKFLLCTLIFCLCNPLCGAAQKNFKYTEEEENAIIRELLRYPGDTKPIHGLKIWIQIAEHISEMRKTDTFSFPTDRNPKSLSTHFQQSMLKKQGKVPVPDVLLQRLPIPRKRQVTEQPNFNPQENEGNKKARLHDDQYTFEEDQFVIDEVLAYPHKPVPIHGTEMWSKVSERLEEKRKLNPAQFSHGRTKYSLRNRFRRILNCMGKGPERDKLMQTIRGDAPREIKFKYTAEEENVIIRELLRYPGDTKPIYGPKIWRKIAKKLSEVRKTNPDSVFPTERKPEGLSSHFHKSMLKEKGIVPLPDILLQKLPTSSKRQVCENFSVNERPDLRPGENMANKKARLHDHQYSYWGRYSSEEDKFIIDEVLAYPRRPVPVHGTEMWSKVADRLEEKRKLDPAQYSHERSKHSLRMRFRRILMSMGKGPERDKLIQTIQGEDPTKNKKRKDTEEEAEWASMIDELQNNSVEVDFATL